MAVAESLPPRRDQALNLPSGQRLLAFLGADRLWMWTRLAAVVSVPLVAIWFGMPVDVRIVVALAVWVLVSSLAPGRRITAVVDVLVASFLVFATGSIASPFLLYVMTAAAGAGVAYGGLAGTAFGAVISVARLVGLMASGTLANYSEELLFMTAAVLPLTGLAAGMTVDVRRRPRTGRALLEQANRLLVQLHDVAGEIPGGLDVATVADAAWQELRVVGRAPDCCVLVAGGDLLRPLAATIDRSDIGPITVSSVDRLVGDGHHLRSGIQLREYLGGDFPRPHWAVVPLRSRETTVGLFLIGYDDVHAARAARAEVNDLARETALALDNATLLETTTARAAESVRRRIAHDLHDSVAQSLAHIKMELELLTMVADDPDDLRSETARLARVAGRALNDVRETITGLRSDSGDGIIAALRQRVEDLRQPGGPRLSFEARGSTDIAPWIHPELLRMTQEAVSNAVRHANARTVSVTLEVDQEVIELVVEDDGRGVQRRSHDRDGHGVGLRAMLDRAAHVGGELTVRDRVGGGTVVALRCPQQRGDSLRRMAGGVLGVAP